MNIDKFKHQHENIYACIRDLRNYTHAGISENAERIARLVVSMSSTIKLHLSVEDKLLYPVLQASRDPALARMGQDYQEEMKTIAAAYDAFSRRWNTATSVAAEPESFRSDANNVLKMLHGRIQQEDQRFYPVIEAI